MTSILTALLAVVVIASPAWAQQRPRASAERGAVPRTGMIGVGMSISAAVPSAEDLGNGPDIAANVERYFTPRLSLRAQLGGAWADILGQPFSGTVRPLTLNGNVVYNWEGGALHPYVTAGAGLYRYRFEENSIVSADNKLGANLGAGAEYFVGRHDTVTGEVLAHVVPGRAQSRLTTYNARFYTLAIGYKRYF